MYVLYIGSITGICVRNEATVKFHALLGQSDAFTHRGEEQRADMVLARSPV